MQYIEKKSMIAAASPAIAPQAKPAIPPQAKRNTNTKSSSRYLVYAQIAEMVKIAKTQEGTDKLTFDRFGKSLRSLANLNDFAAVVKFVDFLVERGYLHVAREDKPGLQECYFCYANAFLKLGEAARAKSILESFLRRHPGSASAIRLLASVERHEDPAKARELLRSLGVAELRTEIGAGLTLVELLAEFGERDAALDLAVALKNDRNFAEVSLAIANLREEPTSKIHWLNVFFREQGLSPVALTNGAQGGLLDGLSAATPHEADYGPLVSVLMTTFNSRAFVRTAARSILEQSYRNLELWIVDDASTDGTQEILKELEAADSRVKLILKTENQGTYASKNRALERAAGAFVTCHDSDDWAHPERIESELSALLREPNLVGITSSWVRITTDGKFTLKTSGRYIHANPAALMFRREAVLDKIGYFDSVRTGADTEFRRRMMMWFGDGAVAHRDVAYALGRLHESSLTQYGPAAMNEFGGSPVRLAYTGSWLDWHCEIESQGKQGIRVEQAPGQRRFWAPSQIMPEHSGTDMVPEAYQDSFLRLGPLHQQSFEPTNFSFLSDS